MSGSHDSQVWRRGTVSEEEDPPKKKPKKLKEAESAGLYFDAKTGFWRNNVTKDAVLDQYSRPLTRRRKFKT